MMGYKCALSSFEQCNKDLEAQEDWCALSKVWGFFEQSSPFFTSQ